MNLNQITVRPAEQRDVLTMTSLLAELFAVEEDFQADPDRQQAGLRLLLESDNAIVLVAATPDRVIGMCTGQTVISTAEGGPALLVEDVIVQKAFAGRGIGRKLLANLASEAGRKGIARMQLLADRNNSSALHFYHKTGWDSTELICLRQRITNSRLSDFTV